MEEKIINDIRTRIKRFNFLDEYLVSENFKKDYEGVIVDILVRKIKINPNDIIMAFLRTKRYNLLDGLLGVFRSKAVQRINWEFNQEIVNELVKRGHEFQPIMTYLKYYLTLCDANNTNPSIINITIFHPHRREELDFWIDFLKTGANYKLKFNYSDLGHSVFDAILIQKYDYFQEYFQNIIQNISKEHNSHERIKSYLLNKLTLNHSDMERKKEFLES